MQTFFFCNEHYHIKKFQGNWNDCSWENTVKNIHEINGEIEDDVIWRNLDVLKFLYEAFRVQNSKITRWKYPAYFAMGLLNIKKANCSTEVWFRIMVNYNFDTHILPLPNNCSFLQLGNYTLNYDSDCFVVDGGSRILPE